MIRKILIIEDEANIADFIKMELEYEIPKTCTAEVIVKEGESYEERI